MPQVIASTYELMEKIGSGGGGTVYLAQHLRLKKKVVLKADKRKLTVSQELLRREVDILKELSHPYIPKVYDFFVDGEDVYTVMDYIEGESLNKALKKGEKFSQAQVIRWACQLLDALCYLHSPVHGKPPKGYVHSDIKPANLMRTTNGDICLIDFNIALALGEENVIGCSAGYASPEHYGLDFSTEDDTTGGGYRRDDEEATLTLAAEDSKPEEEQLTITISEAAANLSKTTGTGASKSASTSSSRKKIVIPDVRSDIYSVGATLYHLLNGKRPSRNAKEVIPLSKEAFSPQVVQIISKAMNPNPDLRYQTAEDMRFELLNLRNNDIRMRKWKRHRRIASVLFPLFFIAGGLVAFAGLKRMQMMESWINLAEYSQKVLAGGDAKAAARTSLQILSDSSEQFMPEHVPGVQKTLTEALGIYDLSDGYKIYKTLELPSPALCLAGASDGKTGAVLYGHTIAVFDTASAKVIAELPAEDSVLSEIKYLGNNVILYAGTDGITAYDVEKACELWSGDPATSIGVSGDGKTVAGIYEEESFATVYDTASGKVRCRIDFNGKRQNRAIKDNLFAINEDGSFLAVSFRDGSLQIYDLVHLGKEFTIYNADSGYRHFEGGFSGQYFAFSAANQEESTFAIIDTLKMEEVGGFRENVDFGVQADENGIYVQSGNVLVKINPVTGEQVPLVDMPEDIVSFDTNGDYTVAASDDGIFFFDKDARLVSRCKKEYKSALACIGTEAAMIGSMDQPVLRIMQYENNQSTEMFAYDSTYQHDEARISSDGKTLTLFSYEGFRVYDKQGVLISEVELADADKVFNQQFVRNGETSCLEVIYNSGKTEIYSAENGSLIREEQREISKERDEEFDIDNLRIESPLHGTPIVYNEETGKEVAQLKEDTYLTYVTKVDEYIVAQYITADGYCSGQLLNEECEILAELPYLCDVAGEELIFDYPTGSVRESGIYDIHELIEMGNDLSGAKR